MSGILYTVRERFHPLNYLRRQPYVRGLLRSIDVPIWARMPGVPWKVRARLVRHFGAFALPQGFEPEIARTFRAIAQVLRPKTFWDVGANIGYYSWLVKSLLPDAEIRMFEPEEDNLSLLRATMSRARLGAVTLRPVAVSDREAECRFVRDEISGSTGGIESGGEDREESTYSEREWGVRGRRIIVRTVTLDGERRSSGRVDLIKIDVEGHEEAVIAGAAEMLEKDQPVIIFECYHGGVEIADRLKKSGYIILDASCSEVKRNTDNFLALPRRYQHFLGTP